MNVYVLADRYGYCHDASPKGHEAELLRERLSADVLAVCEGCMAAGVDQVRVNEFHGGGQWLNFASLPREVELVNGGSGLLGAVVGLADDCDAIMIVGAHTMADSTCCNHGMTFVPGLRLSINGRRFGEIGMFAGLAGAHSAVAAMVCGDEAACQEAGTLVPGIRQVLTKRGLGASGALLVHPEMVGEQLRDIASDAIEACTEIQPFWTQKPVQLEVELSSVGWADACGWIPGIKRNGTRKLAFEGESLIEVFAVLEGIVRLNQ